MKIAVFGATGGTGREIVRQALDAGHDVTALVRDRSRLSLDHPALHVIEGNVLDPVPVDETLRDADAAVISLGNTPNNPEYVVSRGTRSILDSIGRLGGPRRVIAISSIGVGDSRNQVPLAFRTLMVTVLRKAMEDKERQERLLRETDLEWTIVRPAGLTDGPAAGRYREGTDPSITAGRISRADVAAFVVRELAEPRYLHAAPAITG